MHLAVFQEEYPYCSPSLFLVSFLKVGIPLVKLNIVSFGIWNVKKYWFSRGEFPLSRMKLIWLREKFGKILYFPPTFPIFFSKWAFQTLNRIAQNLIPIHQLQSLKCLKSLSEASLLTGWQKKGELIYICKVPWLGQKLIVLNALKTKRTALTRSKILILDRVTRLSRYKWVPFFFGHPVHVKPVSSCLCTTFRCV